MLSTYGLYFLPGSNFATFEEVRVPVSNSAEYFKKSAPWMILEDFGWLGLNKIMSNNMLIKPVKLFLRALSEAAN